MSGFLGGRTPIFEIRDEGGPETDMLIRTPALGAALARSLGGAAYGLLRGHGAVAVGVSLKQVVYRSIYAEVNARLQSEALGLGTITFLNDAEAANAAATNDQVLDRPWELWKKRIADWKR
jgi:HCOMODA/2-hydroxy-3-carboxy-muconic semialdehyde decarboxylase